MIKLPFNAVNIRKNEIFVESEIAQKTESFLSLSASVLFIMVASIKYHKLSSNNLYNKRLFDLFGR